LALFAALREVGFFYRAKTPSTQSKALTYFSEPWCPLRLCARHRLPILSCEIFKYVWLDFGFAIVDSRIIFCQQTTAVFSYLNAEH